MGPSTIQRLQKGCREPERIQQQSMRTTGAVGRIDSMRPTVQHTPIVSELSIRSKVVHISGASMLVKTYIHYKMCALPFRSRQRCRHCRSAETYIRQMLVQRYNNSNHTFAASADRSCRHGRNAARVLTRTRILVQK